MDDFEEIKKDFLVEVEQCLVDTEQCFLSIEKDQSPEVLDRLFRLAHNIKGSANAVGYSELGAFTHDLETLLLKIKKGEIPIDPHVIDILLQCSDHLKFFVSELKTDTNAKVDSAQLLREINDISNNKKESAPQSNTILPEAEVTLIPTTTEEEHPPANTYNEVDRLLGEIDHMATPTQTQVAPANSPSKPKASALADETIRVGLHRLENLINYVGEMVILQAVLKEQINNSGSHLIKKTVHQLGKVTKEVQNISMGLRMIPMKQTFQKMQRIVRDTSRALGKEINFETEGEDTELDKTVLEQLGDPLVHLVRNAVDHGIESADERKNKGKNTTGLVRLKAYNRVGQIVIEVSDDGGGLSAQKLTASAIKKGLLRPGTQLSDEEAHKIVFLPGFSTKEAVTDVSGRGVGMDVVKTNIEGLRGSIQIITNPNQGTCFQITLPLTLAIIDSMIIRQEKQRYILPLHQIYESVEADKIRLQTVSESSEILLLRGENIPFYRLGPLLKIKTKTSSPSDKIQGSALIIRSSHSSTVAILVDEVIGQSQAVIKPLGHEVKNIKGFSGSAILGDGLPAIILDIPELVRQNQGSANVNPTKQQQRRAA